ncbi:DMT family transporter [Dechloromonas sp.]|uniref:DMT family transporter n=1 Tax=Dechloromonas sp. TaxID=1917218 RepID=UPI0012284019|nr:DMT family transporter [Dechloromonas sp.]MBU3695326.1 DMT family transporter [Dechloromonas sp.]TEX48817.1 MAG: EamA family transporter [Rhodocyclaceae bacterium]
MTPIRLIPLTLLVLLAFAGNSILCRLALRATTIDPATFTSVRLLSGALVLWVLVSLFRRNVRGRGNWGSALALLAYAATLSYAYIDLPTGLGALLLFAAVQVTMIGHALTHGERLQIDQWLGLGLAIAGLVGLLLPGLTAPPLIGSVLMLASGVAWGVYSLRGKGAGDPTRVTAGNFMRAVPIALLLSLVSLGQTQWDATGVLYAVISGGITSGLGYSLWYMVLPHLRSTTAASLQLSVPVIASLGGVLFVGEALTLRLVLAAIAILGGIALVIRGRR